MNMMDTSPRYGHEKRAKKITQYECYGCPHYVFHQLWGIPYCHNPDVKITEIHDPREIPDWCPLEDA